MHKPSAWNRGWNVTRGTCTFIRFHHRCKQKHRWNKWNHRFRDSRNWIRYCTHIQHQRRSTWKEINNKVIPLQELFHTSWSESSHRQRNQPYQYPRKIHWNQRFETCVGVARTLSYGQSNQSFWWSCVDCQNAERVRLWLWNSMGRWKQKDRTKLQEGIFVLQRSLIEWKTI